MNIAKFFRTAFLKEHLRWLLLHQMVVMGHHGPLLRLHFAERILTTIYPKCLQLTHIGNFILYFDKINPKQQQQPVADLFDKN